LFFDVRYFVLISKLRYKMKKLITTLLILSGFISVLSSQELFYLEENWETPESQGRWTQEPVIPSKQWEFTYGGAVGIRRSAV
jgi:hypothetical protein